MPLSGAGMKASAGAGFRLGSDVKHLKQNVAPGLKIRSDE
jgi:hypothetical protein